MTRRPPRMRSIGVRLTATMVLSSLLVALTVTAVQMLIVYRSQVDAAHQQLDEIERSIVPGLDAGLRQVDPVRVDLLLDGLGQLPNVGYVELQGEGRRSTRGDAANASLLERTYTLGYDDGTRHSLGTLRVRIAAEPTVRRLRNATVRNLLVTLATLLAASLLLSLLFRHWVTRHLQGMAEYAAQLDFGHLQTPLQLRRRRHRHPDELDQVASALNQMRARMMDELAVRTSHEQELHMHRERLASLVEARTAELRQRSEQLEQQREEMQRLANTDSLTGTCSRRQFFALFQHEIASARRGGAYLAVLMMDVDHFKRVNDEHGHAVGDRVLALLADACRGQLREVDVIGRLGGEEFGILLPGTDARAAVVVAERVRTAIANQSLVTEDGRVVTFTVSIGVCDMAIARGSMDRALVCADRQLYRAKREGRNRVCVAEVADATGTS